jgi:hypothetical protein
MIHPPNYDHLAAMTDDNGLFEHALHDVPRAEHGYCVDDVSRALVVTVREPDQTPLLARLSETYLRFLESAQDPDGKSHNRMAADGGWEDRASLGDWWGRSVWAFGIASVHARDDFTRKRAARAFHRGAANRSPDMRSMVFAALGATEVVLANPSDDVARSLLTSAVDPLLKSGNRAWPWPESRLRYANGAVAEAVIGAGQALGDAAMLERGLELLTFLLEIETTEDHFSVTGSAGRQRDEVGPLFAQQPIEVAALVDACARAFSATSDQRWLSGVELGFGWFLGNNDGHALMFDEPSGAGYDGLERSGRNENRGAESTLAALSTYQQARRLTMLASTVA